MQLVKKWDKDIQRYRIVDIPDSWHIYPDNMNDFDEMVNCVCCGKRIPFGDSYTSRIYHNPWGFGYCECEKCYEKNFNLGE